MRRLILVVLAVLVFGSSLSLGQAAFGKVAGSVTDPAGGIVLGARVTLTSLSTNEKRTVSAGKDGRYEFVNVNPGQYDIDVESPGFKPFARSPIIVDTEQEARINVVLQVLILTPTMVTAAVPIAEPLKESKKEKKKSSKKKSKKSGEQPATPPESAPPQ